MNKASAPILPNLQRQTKTDVKPQGTCKWGFLNQLYFYINKAN